MSEHILLGVDAHLSSSTQLALHTISELVDQAALPISLTLLHVIPFTQTIASHPGYYVDHIAPLTPSPRQYAEAEETLRMARNLLHAQGVANQQVEEIIRVGIPADEIVKTARELHSQVIVIGSRGDTVKQRIRRFFLGSVSRRVLRFAPCPVMIVVPPQTPRTNDLTGWYEHAIQQYLSKHPHTLSVFTPQLVTQQFSPPPQKDSESLRIKAAERALEQLVETGLLCRQVIDGRVRYFND